MIRYLAGCLLLWPAASALAQITGDLTVTEVDFYSVMTTAATQWPIYEPNDIANTPVPPPGTGQILFDGGEITFPQDWSCSRCQRYATVVASLQAPAPPLCHDDTATVTVSVRVENLGPSAGRLYSGALRLIGDGEPVDWQTRTLAAQSTVNTPVGQPRTLSVTATVPADDLIAGRIYAELDLETIDSRAPKSWRADEFQPTYAFGNSSCSADLSVGKSVTPEATPVGGNVSYTLVVGNNGPAAADGAIVTDPGAPGLNCTTLNCSAADGATCPASPTPAQLAAGLAIPTLPASSAVTLELGCTVEAVP